MKRSYFVIPLSFLFHFSALNLILYLCTPDTYINGYYILYINAAWILITYSINFYQTARNERFSTNLKNFIRLFLVFGLAYFSSFAFFGKNSYPIPFLFVVYSLFFLVLSILKIFFYWLKNAYIKKWTLPRKVVVVGWDKNLKKIRQIFDSSENEFVYMGFFANKPSKSATYLGPIENSFEFIKNNEINEIYCVASELSKIEINSLIAIADNGLKKLKIIPDNKELFTRNMNIELYGSVPVLNLRASPFDMEYALLVKRVFDIIFSGLVILFLLSWLIPIIAILIKLDSRGPVFFFQERHGINKKTFSCFKFRSMKVNNECDSTMAKKDDVRITKLGRFLRKTNIDELPQFFNVFKGEMSVVGPRPHMVSHTYQYEKEVDKYLVRHFLKPGITGLAQIKGYRGEIVNKSDIEYRLNYDIFYLEKWSLGLDIWIIFYTVLNVFKGEEKAY